MHVAFITMYTLRFPICAARICSSVQPSLSSSSLRLITTSRAQKMSDHPAPSALRITPIETEDYDEWERLFRLYIEFYKTSLPDAQYPRTFARILDPQNDLYGLVLRDVNNPRKLYGLAHYFPTQTTWAEEMLMHLNGKSHTLQQLSLSSWSP